MYGIGYLHSPAKQYIIHRDSTTFLFNPKCLMIWFVYTHLFLHKKDTGTELHKPGAHLGAVKKKLTVNNRQVNES